MQLHFAQPAPLCRPGVFASPGVEAHLRGFFSGNSGASSLKDPGALEYFPGFICEEARTHSCFWTIGVDRRDPGNGGRMLDGNARRDRAEGKKKSRDQ